ncbi:Butyryl-CoA dehydrogenase [Alloactinosynnema sp. L-07]|uniref:acyl-CoA dehydrogenase family protein n=1 Tax=Alloactinosynnema sp. L-07 TaxID=1653480 RepID=UPI00065F0776|nr:acyl-CoA dehydrogenase family protein [Alloactinosynnema sp. L-07]CRK59564.1 Butyryl-CoA dehydrogenase [Alloactinosynnema sp. L-07]
MDFSLTEAQNDLAGLVRSLVDTSRPLWNVLDEAGVLSAALPTSVGGSGFGLLEQCTIAMELGRAAASTPYASWVTACSALASMEGSPTCAVIDDPLDPVEATGGRLSGTKMLVPEGDVFAVTAGADAYVANATDPGVSVTAQELVSGNALMVTFSDTPARRLPDTAASISQNLTALTCAEALGVLEEALRRTAAYAGERVQFGKPIGTFQAVTQRLADAYIDVAAVRLTLWQAAWLLSEGLPAEAEVATAKFWTADACHRVAHTAVHVHGGVGLDTSHTLQKYFTAAKRLEFTLGDATAQLKVIGSCLAQ